MDINALIIATIKLVFSQQSQHFHTMGVVSTGCCECDANWSGFTVNGPAKWEAAVEERPNQLP